MHGPASEGAAISASEVTSSRGTASSSWSASDAVEDRRDDRDVLVEVAHEQREPQRQLVAGRDEADDVGAPIRERVADRGVVGLLAAADLGAALLERRAHLLEQVAEAGEQHAAALGHGRSVPGVAFRR